jgi:glyoxylase-like metal-dependent hydrolase (beta-lactamase superfamily II)/8-oxo-dGTP pyrophosphatase MutT (NUDIX family)
VSPRLASRKEDVLVNPIAEAASLLLARGPGSPEVFVVRRAEALRFFGGFWAFPGGKVAAADAELLPAGEPGGDRALQVRRITAARELFEETGVLLARRPDGSSCAAGPELEHLRREMMAGHVSFREILARLGLAVRPDDFTPIGALTTPAYAAIRFDTTFFVAELPPGQRAEVWPGELDAGRWTLADALLEEWTRGSCLVAPPTVRLLGAIRGRPVSEAPRHFARRLQTHNAGGVPAIDFAPAVQMLPLATQALPPSTHTNAYLIGTGPVYLLDPGPADPDEQGRLFELLDTVQGEGRPLTAIVLSHQHPDHVGAAAVCARRYGIPVWAHPRTAQALRGRVEVTRELHGGDRLDLGPAPDGSGPWHLEALHTPGHAAGHLAFYEPYYRLLFAGDMVSTLSSVVIAPPDGDLATYLESLHRLRGLDCRLLLPGHGSPSARPGLTIDECLEHRARRERQLLAALGESPRTADELAGELYRGLAPDLMRFARWQVVAGLQKLQREGRVMAAGDGAEPRWCQVPRPDLGS